MDLQEEGSELGGLLNVVICGMPSVNVIWLLLIESSVFHMKILVLAGAGLIRLRDEPTLS